MIQIDMPMPTNCLDCPACNEYLMCAIPVNGRNGEKTMFVSSVKVDRNGVR